MKLQHFRNVVAIVEHGSLRAAARSLQLEQPALSRSLRDLERELGASLFERHPRGMTLTAAGTAFARRASAVLGEVERARDEVVRFTERGGESLAIALSIAAHIALLPKSLHHFRERYPNVQLHVIEGLYPTVEAGLRSGGIDFYVGPMTEQALPADLLQERLFGNRRTVLCRKDHPLAGAHSLADLVGAKWATTSITWRAEDELRSLFERHGLAPPTLSLRSQSALTLIVSLANSDLLAMVPIQWIELAPTANVLAAIDVREPLPAPGIVLVRRAGVPLTPAAAYLSAQFSKAVSTLPAM